MRNRLALFGAGLLAAATAWITILHPAPPRPEGPLPPARHEARDVGARALFIAGLLMLLTLAGLMGLAAWIFPQSLRDRIVPQAAEQFPAPQLQPSPASDMTAFRAQQLRQLDSIYWLDTAKTRLHLPIAQAMQKLAHDGIPDWPAK